jgi:ABC-type multidrug transport system fused ATPase/permease subunit
MNLGDKSTDFFIGVYAAIAFTFYLLVAWRSLLMVAFQINTSRYFHSTMLESTLRATMAFFETTPAGQILNRYFH